MSLLCPRPFLGRLTADGIEALPTLLQVLLSPLVQGTNHANGCKGETLPSRRIPVFLLSAADPPPNRTELLCQLLEIRSRTVSISG